MPITLKAARINKGLTQAEAGKLLGVSICTLVNWESGKTFPDAMDILKIQDTYDVRYDDLIFLPESNALSVTGSDTPATSQPAQNKEGENV